MKILARRRGGAGVLGEEDWKLLGRVARSFAITIRWLPSEIRETVALGYLLARASDSIADSSGAEVVRRVGALRELERFEVGSGVVEGMAKLQGVAAEAELVRALPDLMERMRGSEDRDRLEWVWTRILEGQMFDLERFGDGGGELAVEEVDRYTYLVAGCVGEFWTELSFDRVPRFSRAGRAELVRLGADYGKGLQRVNILRDRAADREARADLRGRRGLRSSQGRGVGRARGRAGVGAAGRPTADAGGVRAPGAGGDGDVAGVAGGRGGGGEDLAGEVAGVGVAGVGGVVGVVGGPMGFWISVVPGWKPALSGYSSSSVRSWLAASLVMASAIAVTAGSSSRSSGAQGTW